MQQTAAIISVIGNVSQPRLAAAGAADDENIFVSRILWLLRAAGHGEAFCPGQRDVPIGNRVYVGRDIRRRAPAGRAVFNTLAVFLRILALDIHRQPDEDRAEDTDADIQRMKAGCGAGKGCLEALPDMQQLFRGVEPRRQPHRLAELIKEAQTMRIRMDRNRQLHRQQVLNTLITAYSTGNLAITTLRIFHL